MPKTKEQKRKAKRKAKLKSRRNKITRELQKERSDFFFHEAQWFIGHEEYEKALLKLNKAIRLDPVNKEMLETMAYLGSQIVRPDIELKGLSGLYDNGLLSNDRLPDLCHLLARKGKNQQAIATAKETLSILPKIKISNKRNIRSFLINIIESCEFYLKTKQVHAGQKDRLNRLPAAGKPVKTGKTLKPAINTGSPLKPVKPKRPVLLPEIPVSIGIDSASFLNTLSSGQFASPMRYKLAIEAHQIRFNETFENLICLSNLKHVRSLWYQEETARKILKSFRGRALLSDEVGLGKTIEAGIVLKEYIARGMVKNALILTPTPLVSQWQEELKTKFGLNLPSTDDPDYNVNGDAFWKEPFILSSINIAKSKKNYPLVTRREYDLVIVDEAHHLKNRNTLNWKLINSLKKRFLLLLTATPVENNLMELYNLVTLLKPGQLKTASAFRKEFMTRGDPTDPQNRSKLKGLLGQVMIRNTRALARVDIPPRFAQTIKINSSKHERQLYERICALVKSINETNGTRYKILLKTLLAEAGSSPRAVSLTLSRMLMKKNFLLKQEKEIRAINNLCKTMDDTSKNKVLLKLLKSSPGKSIIFVKYLGTLDHLSDFLTWQEIPHARFHGGMNNKKKDGEIKCFMEDKDILVTTEIGGEGRNLQFCHQMVNYDLPWNPMKIEQRIGRIHRIGQDKEVMIYNLCAGGSIEEYILEVLDKKINMFEMIIGEIDMIMGRVKGEQEFSEMVYDIWVGTASEKERDKAFSQLAVKLKQSKVSYQKTKALDKKLFGENYEL